MSWYNTLGPCPNYVLFSKVRYIRNLSNIPFYHLADSKRAEEVIKQAGEILSENGFRGERIDHGVSPALISLAEKHFADRDFVESKRTRALYLNEPCNLLVALGGENFISICSIVSGLAVTEAKNMASGAEELLDSQLSFAYSDGIGYLSPSVSDCGSGIEYSAALFLPSLRIEGELECLASQLSKLGMRLFPTFTSAYSGDIYTLSYVPPYLVDEESATALFASTAEKIADNEMKRLRMIFPQSDGAVTDTALRAQGQLLFARQISEEELLSSLAAIRLAIALADGENASELPSICDLNFLLAEGQSCSVIACANAPCRSYEECNALRAKTVKDYINCKKEVL